MKEKLNSSHSLPSWFHSFQLYEVLIFCFPKDCYITAILTFVKLTTVFKKSLENFLQLLKLFYNFTKINLKHFESFDCFHCLHSMLPVIFGFPDNSALTTPFAYWQEMQTVSEPPARSKIEVFPQTALMFCILYDIRLILFYNWEFITKQICYLYFFCT